jgi:hypothetical protein
LRHAYRLHVEARQKVDRVQAPSASSGIRMIRIRYVLARSSPGQTVGRLLSLSRRLDALVVDVNTIEDLWPGAK